MEKKNGADSCNSKMTITKEFDFAGETVKYVHVPSFFMSSSLSHIMNSTQLILYTEN